MPRTRLALVALVVAILASPAAAQDEPVRGKATIAGGRLGPTSAEVRVTIVVDAAWHIYATSTPNGSPTKLELELPAGVERDGPLVEPEPHAEEMEYVGPMKLHRGTLELVQRLRVGPGAASIPVTVTFQTCDDANTRCLPDVVTKGVVDVPAAGAPGSAPPGPAAPGPAAAGAPGPAPAAPAAPTLPQVGAEQQVVVRAALSPATAPPGGVVDLLVELEVGAGFHIYGATSPNGGPTTLAVESAGVAVEGPLGEPPAHAGTDPFLGPVTTHEGTVRFTQRLRVAEGAAPGSRPVKVTAAWQACDAQGCTPSELVFELPLEVAAGSATAPVATATPTAVTPAGPVTPTGAQPARSPADGDLLELALASMLLGIVMLFQPCTYPMIPITVSIFSKGKKLPRPRAVARAGIYALGIIVSFVVIGAAVQVAFGADGQARLNALAVNPWVNLVIGGLFVYFAFSFFGYYELGLPQPLMNLMQLGSAKRDDEGTVPWWSLFLMGAFFVLTSYTCGAPIVLALFSTSAQSQSSGAVVFATAIFATTVALPFFALSLAPGAVRSLPKSGEWFSVFKAVLGFAELAFALKFLRGADVAWELGALNRSVLLVLWTVLSLSAAIYLLGRYPLKFPHDPDLKESSTGRGFFAALLLGIGLYFASGIRGAELHPNVEAFILPDEHVEGDEIRWGPDPAEGQKDERPAYRLSLKGYEDGLARARRTGKPMLVMFTGHQCSNCVAMEKGILPRPEVVSRIDDIPRVSLFTDRGEEEKKHLALMKNNFRTTVLPSFYLVNGDGEVLSQQNGGTDLQGFIAFLERGGLTE